MFEVNKINVTDEDILFVENHFGFSFNEGQKKLIKTWNSTDIQACPGGGKTTTLAAKLIILANKLPKSYQQGICIITHTNVAVEEIKQKLGQYSNFYFNYPNHFGTIQSVVDRFLTIPAYKTAYKYSPSIVDNETYVREVNRFNLLTGTAKLFSLKGIDEIGFLSFNKVNFLVSKSINTPDPIKLKGISEKKMAIHYEKIKEVKTKLLQEGYVKYDEAYSIAFKYLRKYPQIIPLFAKRFSLVFIDEMQDMESHQAEIISKLFGGTTAVVQKIGDINQAIYSSHSDEVENEWKPMISEEIKLTKTTRLSDNIAQTIKDICISPQEITGWENPNPIPITIIVYNNTNIHQVKDKFIELILHNNLPSNSIYKVVGARLGDSKLNINSYWNEYNRSYEKRDFSNLLSFITKAQDLNAVKTNAREIREIFLRAICKALKIAKIKSPSTNYYFTPYSLFQYLSFQKENGFVTKLNIQLSKWILNVSEIEKIKTELINLITELILLFTEQKENKELKAFYEDTTIETETQRPIQKTYTNSNVNLIFDTIHGVKGETHTATLYLETFNRIYDIGEKILEFIISDEKQKGKYRKNDAFKKRLPLAYVAMTRPTHFLSLAVHVERFTEEHKTYFENNENWQVIYL